MIDTAASACPMSTAIRRAEAAAGEGGEEVGEAPAERRDQAVDHAGGFASASASTATAPRGPTSNGFASSEVTPIAKVVRGARDRLDGLRDRAEVMLVLVQPAPLGLRRHERAGLLRGQRRGHERRFSRLRQRAARADGDRRAELLVDQGAHEHLVPVHHLLHEHARRPGAGAASRLQHLGRRGLHLAPGRAGRDGRRRAAPCAGSRAPAPSRPRAPRSSARRRPRARASRRPLPSGRRTPYSSSTFAPPSPRPAARTGRAAPAGRRRGSGAARAPAPRGRPPAGARAAPGSRPTLPGVPAGTAAASTFA